MFLSCRREKEDKQRIAHLESRMQTGGRGASASGHEPAATQGRAIHVITNRAGDFASRDCPVENNRRDRHLATEGTVELAWLLGSQIVSVAV